MVRWVMLMVNNNKEARKRDRALLSVRGTGEDRREVVRFG